MFSSVCVCVCVCDMCFALEQSSCLSAFKISDSHSDGGCKQQKIQGFLSLDVSQDLKTTKPFLKLNHSKHMLGTSNLNTFLHSVKHSNLEEKRFEIHQLDTPVF